MGMVGTTLMPKAASMYDTDACALIVICTEEKNVSSCWINGTTNHFLFYLFLASPSSPFRNEL